MPNLRITELTLFLVDLNARLGQHVRDPVQLLFPRLIYFDDVINILEDVLPAPWPK